jgi:methionyl-tRNA formyltransferase
VNKLRVIFAGTPVFAVSSLKALTMRKDIEIVAVYTQPDRPAGRGRKLKPSPVKVFAEEFSLKVNTPIDLKSTETRNQIAELKPDLLIVVAYGLLLPKAVIDIPIAAINIHASLLPRWRGSAPIQRAIMAGDTSSGISIMKIIEKLDAGPVLLKKAHVMRENENSRTLHEVLATLGSAGLNEVIDKFLSNTLTEQVQDESLVTYAKKITAIDQQIDWTKPSCEIERKIRALSPKPGAKAILKGLDLKILSANEGPLNTYRRACGEVFRTDTDDLSVTTGDSSIVISSLQVSGKNPMTTKAFLNGHKELF